MTLGQLNSYLTFWGGKQDKGEDSEGFTDLEMFNLVAGIPKKIIQKK